MRDTHVMCAALLIAAAIQMPAHAQEPSHWGLTTSFTPNWVAATQLKVVFDDPDTLDVSGSEFRVGVVRGKEQGGDWGVAFVMKRLKNNSTIAFGPSQFCGFETCFDTSTTVTTRDSRLLGLELHKYANIATIKQRAQIGIEFAGGVAQVRGEVLRTEIYPDYVLGENRRILDYIPARSEEVLPARRLFVAEIETLPLARLELALGVLAAPGLKIRASGGLNFPGTQVFSIRAIYLFGHK